MAAAYPDDAMGDFMDKGTRGWSGRGVVITMALAWVAVSGQACVEEPNDALGPRDAEFPLHQPPSVQKVPAPLAGAHCEIDVEGQGVLDMEMDYLPHVIQCENGGANLEALKAQAIAARSVGYYAIETSGGICDSQGCQVYGCGSTPQAIHYQAVEETSGIYLMFNGTLTYGFYVAGDNSTSPPSCVGVSGATEHWVTYNEGQTSTDVEQTELGFVHDPADPGYGQNRGCMSQWGARCLENDNGYDYLDILRFYYGDDIQTIQAEGACVLPLDDETGTSSGGDSSGGSEGDASGGGEGDASTGAGGEGPMTEGGDDDPPPPPGGTSGAPDDPEASAGTIADDGSALPTTFGQDTDDSGCTCRSSGPSGGTPWLLSLLGLLGWRRRRP